MINMYKLTHAQAREAVINIRRVIHSYFQDNNITYAIFGKSEGLDSSVVAGLLSGISGIKPIGVLMPCESNPEAARIARLVLEQYNIPWIQVDLTEELHALTALYYSTDSVQDQLSKIVQDDISYKTMIQRKARAIGNIKARLRMITLYHIAQLTGGLVISTDNLSELWMGFWTLNGDVGDLAPIQHVWKGLELYTIAEVLGVPKESLEAIPTDGLDVVPGGVDEDQLGLPYPELDRVIVSLLQNKYDGTQDNALIEVIAAETGCTVDAVAHVAHRITNTNFKRHWPRVIARTETGLLDIETL